MFMMMMMMMTFMGFLSLYYNIIGDDRSWCGPRICIMISLVKNEDGDGVEIIDDDRAREPIAERVSVPGPDHSV